MEINDLPEKCLGCNKINYCSHILGFCYGDLNKDEKIKADKYL